MIRIAAETFGSVGWHDMVELRARVLRAPLGLAFTAAELEAECHDLHLALRLDGAVAGTLVIRRAPPPHHAGAARFRQMAIRPDLRGRGFGAALLRAGEQRALGTGATTLRLHARLEAAGFYARFGWVADGPVFTEVTVPHVAMGKEAAAPVGRSAGLRRG